MKEERRSTLRRLPVSTIYNQKRYYTSTPEMLKKYAEIVPLVDDQK